MKKILFTSLGVLVIFLIISTSFSIVSVDRVAAYKISMYLDPKCDGYVARCGLPGSECDRVVNPTCFSMPD